MDQEYGDGREETTPFSEAELVYLSQHQLARVATSSADGQPHVVPVVYEFDGKYAYFSGWNLRKSLKFKNILINPKVAIVVDDLKTVSPWKPRGIELRGRAEVLRERGSYCVRVTIDSKRSWGLD
ncbi:MAG: PPOX class F420-dependent oxidoreductase [Thaumarchaeota archaeon]|nr:PPOX class F420-dependent oxidoreductase [Nitrososphaerota archaeon]